MNWDDDIAISGLEHELKVLQLLVFTSTGIPDGGRESILREIRGLRRVVAQCIRNKTIPYPSKADPDIIAAVMRALLAQDGIS